LLRVESLSGQVERTLTTQAELGGEGGAMIFSGKGTALYRVDRESAWRVVPEDSVTFAEAPFSVLARFARGSHDAYAVYWGHGTFPILDQWLSNRRVANPGAGKAIGTQPVYPVFKDAYDRFVSALDVPEGQAEHLVASVILELAGQILTADHAHGLAPAPRDTPELLMNLIREVRDHPSVPWPLKEAADFVGYSPFHFSRIFKAQVGMGFHEFVDRTRTEYAVHLLTSTDHPIDVVASEAGFGTTQGLRESVKEYLGLVPSELRSYADDFTD